MSSKIFLAGMFSVLSSLLLAIAIVYSATATSTGQTGRAVTLIGEGKARVRVESNAATLPAEIDAKSIRVLIDGGPVSLCERQNFGNICMRILNKRIACDLVNCFSGAGDWRNRIRSVRFD